MKAAYIEATGPADSTVRYGDLPKPQPTGQEVLVKVGAVAVNPIDTYLRNGANYWPLPRPFIIGCDLAGTVESVGPEAKRFKPGDRVWGSNQGLMGRQGTFAEYAAVEEQWLYPTPENVTDEQAAACARGDHGSLGALPRCAAPVGRGNLRQRRHGRCRFDGGANGKDRRGPRDLDGRQLGQVAALAKLGVDKALNYKTDDIAAAVQGFAAGGVNVYWETAREPDFEKIVGYLAERGRIVLMAGRDARPPFPVGPFYVKGCSLFGFVMFKATADQQRAAAEDINRWLAAGQLRANIGRVLPLSAAAEAHTLQEANTLHKAGTLGGKIVLKP